MKNKIFSLLGFAAKSGNLSYGFEKSVEAMKNNKSQLILAAEDVSEKTKKEITFFAQKTNKRHIFPKGITIMSLTDALGKKCGVVSVNDKGFAQAIEEAYLEGGVN